MTPQRLTLLSLLCCLCSVFAFAQPAAPTVTGNTTFCTGSGTTLTAVGQAGATFQWWTADTGGTQLSATDIYTVPVQSIAGTYNYYVEQVVGGLVSARTNVSVTVNAMPLLTAVPAATVTEGSIITLTAATNTGTNPAWVANQGSYVSNQGLSAYAVPTENTTYTATVSASNGCLATASTAITLDRLPKVSGVLQICPNTSTTLTANGTGPFVWYDAAVGGTVLYTGASYATPVLPVSTSYWVTDNGGPRKQVSVYVPSDALPTVVATPSIICAGDTSRLGSPGYPGLLSWFTTPTGGTPIGTSSATTLLAVNPTVSTTYYAEATPFQSSVIFNAIGAIQTWTVPANVTSINVTAYGAKSFGWGGGVQTTLNVTPGQVLYLYVGTSSGWNGGGTGVSINVGSGTNGAGATDIRINGQDLLNRIIVAGGGGGCAYYNYPIISWSGGRGDGGGLTGQDGPYYISSTNFGASPSAYANSVGWGGTQSAGGKGYTVWGQPYNGYGGFGYGGGSPSRITFIVGCGGGGWYGGGASTESVRYGGGGGSSYTNPQLCQNVVHTQGANNGQGQVIITYGATCSGITNARIPVVVTVPSFFKPTVISNAPSPCAGSPLTLTVPGFAPSKEVGAFSGSQSQANSAGTGGIPAAANDFTLDFWVKPTDSIALVTPAANTTIGVTGQRFAVYPQQGGNDAGAGISVGKNGIQVCEHGNNYLPVLLSFKGPLPDTSFTHVAVVYSAKTPQLYINGALAATGLTSTRPNVYPSIGSGGTSGYGSFKGQLDNVRIWSAALTQNEIRGILNQSDTLLTGKILAARYSFDSGSLADDKGVPTQASWSALTGSPQQDYRIYNWTTTNAAPTPNSNGETQTVTIQTIPPDTRPWYLLKVGGNGCSSIANDTLFPNIGNVPTASFTGPSFTCQGADTTVVLQAFNAKAPFTFSYTLNGGPTQTVSTTAQRIRYIRVRQNAADCFHLSELRAMDYYTGLNVALGKTVTASSSTPTDPSNKLTDGDVYSKWHSSNCQTSGEYVEVDLGAAYRLDNIQLVNRQDCCWERAQNLQLILKDSSGAQLSNRTIDAYQGVNSGYTTRWPAEVISLPLPTTVSGTYQYTLQSVTSALGCTNTQSSSLTATVLTPVAPAIQLLASTGTELCASAPVKFTALLNDTAAATYTWYQNGIAAGTNSTYTSPPINDRDSIAFVAINTRGCAGPAATAYLKMRINKPLQDSIIGTGCGLNPIQAWVSATPYSLAWKQNSTLLATGYTTWGSATTVATSSNPAHLFVDTAGNVYVPEASAHRVTRWAPGATTGVVVAGGNGSGSAANQLSNPLAVYVNSAGDVYVADAGNHRIQRWSLGATSGTLAAGRTGVSGNGAGQLSSPADITMDAGGNLFVADFGNNRIQRWAPNDTVGRTVAGSSTGVAGTTAALLNHPYGIAVDEYGSVLVADRDNHRITKWPAGSSTGSVLLGTGTAGSGMTELNQPTGVAVDGAGNVYIADAANHRIQRRDSMNTVTTIAGTGTSGSSASQLASPTGLALTRTGNLYVSDGGNSRIQNYLPIADSVYTPVSIGNHSVIATSFDGCATTSSNLPVSTPLVLAPAGLSVCQDGDTALLVSGLNAVTPYTFTYSLNGGATQTVNSTIRKVRYVRITQTINYFLNIGEMRILDFSGNNIALGKSVTASAIYNNNANYGASKINDDNDWTPFRSGTTATGYTGGYAEIDLGQEYGVQQVSLFIDYPNVSGGAGYVLRARNLVLTFKDDTGAVVYTQPVNATPTNSLPATTIWPIPLSVTNTASIPITTTAAGTQNYTFTTVAGTGCSATTNTTVAVTINPKATVINLPDSLQVCEGTALALAPTIAGSSSVQWLKDEGVAVGDTNVSYTRPAASTTDNGMYRVITTTAAGCADSSGPVAVVVKPSPIAALSGSSTVCQGMAAAPLALTLANGVAPYNVSYQMNNGVMQTLVVPGTLVRYVRVAQTLSEWTNLAEIEAIEAGTGINVALNKPTIASSNAGGYPATNVNDGSTAFDNYWHSANMASGEYVEIDLGAPGYEVSSITIANRGDCCQSRSSALQLTLKDSAGTQLSTATVNAYQGHDYANTALFPTVLPAAKEIAVSSAVAGAFTYKLINVSAGGCTLAATDSAEVTVNAQATINAQPSAALQVCAPNPLILSAIAPNAMSYQWYKAGAPIAGATTANYIKSISATDSGNYSVIALGAGGCNDTSTSSAVTISTLAQMLPAASANASLLQADGMDIAYTSAACEPIADIADGTGGNVLSGVTATVVIDSSIQTFNGAPYLQRHYDLQPMSNGPATVTLYATQGEFDAFNTWITANALGKPKLPTSPTDTAGLSKLSITQFHGLPSAGDTGPGGQYVATQRTLIPNAAITSTWTGNYWKLSFPVSGFSGFFISTESSTPLAISLLDIRARNLGARNRVDWTSATEDPGDYYEIERSTDGMQFSRIGTLEGIAPQGADYSYTDENPAPGINYYRLGLRDAAGGRTFSKVVSARAEESNAFALEAYPTPVHHILSVHITGTISAGAQVLLTDAAGRIIRQVTITEALTKLPMSDIATGIYLLRYEDATRSQVLRIVKE